MTLSQLMEQHRTGPETDRLTHRAFRPEDADVFYSLNSHPLVMKHTGEPPIESVDAAATAIEEYPDFEEIGYGRWACVLKDTSAVIGFCGLKYLPALDEVDVGYRFFPEYWGQGIATEACSASVQFGFETLGLEKIIAMVLPDNMASRRVLEKVGLQFVGNVEFEGLFPLKYEIRRS